MTETYVTASVHLTAPETDLSAKIRHRESRIVRVDVESQGGPVLTLHGDPETLRNFGEAIAKLAQLAYEELKARPKRGGYWSESVDLRTLTRGSEALTRRVAAEIDARHQDGGQ